MSVSPGPALYRDFMSQAAIDAMYDTSRDVPDVAALLQGYAQSGEHARRTLPYMAKVPYGPTLDEYVDIFPASKPGAPVLLFIHGGYWRAFSAQDFSQVALGPHGLGMTVVIVNYSLCPRVSIDEITRQVRASVAWTMRNAERYNGDTRRLIISGHSAGAHLTAMCLQTRWADDYGLDAQAIRAALMISGIYDIAPLRYSYLQPLIQLDEGIARRNSPMYGVQPSDARILLTWGGNESTEFARQSTEYAAQWQRMGNTAELCEQANGNHFTVLHGLEDPDSPLCQWISGVM